VISYSSHLFLHQPKGGVGHADDAGFQRFIKVGAKILMAIEPALVDGTKKKHQAGDALTPILTKVFTTRNRFGFDNVFSTPAEL
jgi:hypothetical protein